MKKTTRAGVIRACIASSCLVLFAAGASLAHGIPPKAQKTQFSAPVSEREGFIGNVSNVEAAAIYNAKRFDESAVSYSTLARRGLSNDRAAAETAALLFSRLSDAGSADEAVCKTTKAVATEGEMESMRKFYPRALAKAYAKIRHDAFGPGNARMDNALYVSSGILSVNAKNESDPRREIRFSFDKGGDVSTIRDASFVFDGKPVASLRLAMASIMQKACATSSAAATLNVLEEMAWSDAPSAPSRANHSAPKAKGK